MSTTDAAAQRKILNRLKRARGQLDGLIAAVENESNCRDVMTQLSAVTHALNRAGYVVIATAMRDCFRDPEGDANAEQPDAMTPEELEKLFLSMA